MIKADLILSSNAVFTGLLDDVQAGAVAIKDNKILAVGPIAEIKQYQDENTVVKQYEDQLIMPGLHDFHLHLMDGAVKLNSADLFPARSKEEAIQMIADFAKENPDDAWVLGNTWDAGYWTDQTLPTRHDLDAIIPDRPALMFHAEGHYAWVNSKALELANITKETEDPEFGEIAKDSQGELTGILIEQATDPVIVLAYAFSKEEKTVLLHDFLEHAASYGITAVHDLFAAESLENLYDYDLFQSFEKADKLTTRVHLWPQLNGDMETAKKLRQQYQSDKLRVSGLKQFIDGVITSRTAYMLEPYADDPSTRGQSTFPHETIKDWVVAADKENFSIRFHAIGDAAIRLALDAYELAEKQNGKRDARHSVEHIEVIHPDDIPRFKELGVNVSMQPDHFAMSERGVYTDRIGEEREKYVFLINTLKETGANVAFGTDFPIDILSPFLQIYTAMTRTDNTGRDVWHPAEKLTLAEALKAYTVGPAYGCFREAELGTLEAGKLADIAVVDRNLFAVTPEEVKDAQIALTMMDGEIIYEK